MSWLPGRAWRAPLVVTALLLAVLAFLYAQTQGHDESDHFEQMAAVRHLKQLDAAWELEVLQSLTGTSASYDELTSVMSETDAQLESLELSLRRTADDTQPAQNTRLLREAVRDKATLTEEFKSVNAVLRNSLGFLPTAVEQYHETVSRTRGADSESVGRVSAVVDWLLLSTLLYSHQPSDERSLKVQATLDVLDAAGRMAPAELGDRLAIFAAHVGTVLREQPHAARLLSEITATPTATRIGALGNDLSAHQRERGERNAAYRRYMLVFAAALIGLFAFVAGRLAGIYAKVNRANTALQAANENLELAKRQAEAANEAKSDFLAAMSHEIRTPMNGVIGMTQVLRQTRLNSSQAEQAKVIHDSALALLAIVDEVLDFSKIEAGKFQVEQQAMNVAETVEGACDTLAQLAADKGLELRLFIEPDLPREALGDVTRLRRVVLNLLSNAIKFSAGQERVGRVDVRVRARAVDSMSSRFEIEVADNGIGMDEETQARLFSPFMQADMSSTRRFGGTGLGLSLCKGMVDLMGGEIGVQSAPGLGSTFTLRLTMKQVPPSTQADAARPQLHELHCIVISEPDGLGDDLRTYLSHAGATVAAVTTLRDAPRLLAGLAPQPLVVVVDRGEIMALDSLRTICPVGRDDAVSFVLVGRGGRRRPGAVASDAVALNGHAMHRQLFLDAVHMAAQADTPISDYAPLAAVAETALAPLSPTQTKPDRPPILIAEDNVINQQVILTQLAAFGRTADMALNGREALDRWRRHDYRLVITDLHMPEMDGHQLSVAIREHEAATGRRRTPIVALTANAVSGEADRCRDKGMDDCFTKPVQLDVLKALIDKWLGEAAAMPPPTAARATVAAQSTPGVAVDVSVLAALVGDDPQVLRAFLQDFRASAQNANVEMLAAHAAGLLAELGNVAHKLKSAARTVGALDLGELCAQIEEASEHEGVDELAALLPMFEMQIRAVDACLAAGSACTEA